MTAILDQEPDARDGADAFAVLGLPYSPDLTDAEVRAAYLLRLRAVHPDNGGDATAAAAVTAAYDALRSGVRRGELLAAVTVDREGGPREPPRSRPWWGRERAGSAPVRRHPREAEPGMGRVPDPARRDELRRQVAASRAAQGLPPYITDAATLDKIADLLVVTLDRGDQAREHARSAGAAGPPRERASRPPAWEPSAWRRASRRQYAAEREAQQAAAAATSGALLARGWARVRYGRPWWLAARALIVALVVLIAQAAAPGDPAVWALGVGAVTWLVRTGRYDLAPRVRR